MSPRPVLFFPQRQGHSFLLGTLLHPGPTSTFRAWMEQEHRTASQSQRATSPQPVAKTGHQWRMHIPRSLSCFSWGGAISPGQTTPVHLQLGIAMGHFSGEGRLTNAKGQSQSTHGHRQPCSSGSKAQVFIHRPHIYTRHAEGKVEIPSAAEVCGASSLLSGTLCVGLVLLPCILTVPSLPPAELGSPQHCSGASSDGSGPVT